MKSDSNAGAPGSCPDDHLSEVETEGLGNVRSIGSKRPPQTVEDVVKAYFDSLVTETIPDELDALVRRLG